MAKELIRAELGGTPLTADELAAVPDFKGIRKEIWDKFPGAITRQDYKAGEIIMREGESGTTAYLHPLGNDRNLHHTIRFSACRPRKKSPSRAFSAALRS